MPSRASSSPSAHGTRPTKADGGRAEGRGGLVVDADLRQFVAVGPGDPAPVGMAVRAPIAAACPRSRDAAPRRRRPTASKRRSGAWVRTTERGWLVLDPEPGEFVAVGPRCASDEGDVRSATGAAGSSSTPTRAISSPSAHGARPTTGSEVAATVAAGSSSTPSRAISSPSPQGGRPTGGSDRRETVGAGSSSTIRATSSPSAHGVQARVGSVVRTTNAAGSSSTPSRASSSPSAQGAIGGPYRAHPHDQGERIVVERRDRRGGGDLVAVVPRLDWKRVRKTHPKHRGRTVGVVDDGAGGRRGGKPVGLVRQRQRQQHRDADREGPARPRFSVVAVDDDAEGEGVIGDRSAAVPAGGGGAARVCRPGARCRPTGAWVGWSCAAWRRPARPTAP